LWDEKSALLIGQLATYWPLVEDRMIGILGDLLGYAASLGENGPPRQIFRSILSNRARITLMQSLLERSAINRDKEIFYDEVLSEFGKLNGKRNGYLHGIWYTHEDGRTYLSERSIDDFHFLDAREVKYEEIHSVFLRMESLFTLVARRHRGQLDKGMVRFADTGGMTSTPENVRYYVDRYCTLHSIIPAFEISPLADIQQLYRDKAPFPFQDDAGCYLLWSATTELLYVGKVSLRHNIYSRLKTYFRWDEDRTMILPTGHWTSAPTFVQVIKVKEPYQAPSLEEYLIDKLNPSDNFRR
jgi:hypothetical protein